MLDDRQLHMRIGGGVAVSREMLAAGGNAGALQLFDDDAPKPGDDVWPLTEGAVADDGVLWIGMDVEHRCKIERDADGSDLDRERRGKSLRERRIVSEPQPNFLTIVPFTDDTGVPSGTGRPCWPPLETTL